MQNAELLAAAGGASFCILHSAFCIREHRVMKRLPWFLRDAIYLAIFVAVLIAVAYGLDALRFPGAAYYNRIVVLIGINITLAVSLNIINGHAGQFSLGHAGYMAVGAYFSAFLTYFYFTTYADKYPGAQHALFVVAL